MRVVRFATSATATGLFLTLGIGCMLLFLGRNRSGILENARTIPSEKRIESKTHNASQSLEADSSSSRLTIPKGIFSHKVGKAAYDMCTGDSIPDVSSRLVPGATQARTVDADAAKAIVQDQFGDRLFVFESEGYWPVYLSAHEASTSQSIYFRPLVSATVIVQSDVGMVPKSMRLKWAIDSKVLGNGGVVSGPVSSLKINEQGYGTIIDVPAGITIHIWNDEVSIRKKLGCGGDRVIIRLPATGSILGRLIDVGGMPLDHVAVRYDVSFGNVPSHKQKAETDDQGFFEFRRLAASAGVVSFGIVGARTIQTSVTLSETVDLGCIQIPRRVLMSGSVVGDYSRDLDWFVRGKDGVDVEFQLSLTSTFALRILDGPFQIFAEEPMWPESRRMATWTFDGPAEGIILNFEAAMAAVYFELSGPQENLRSYVVYRSEAANRLRILPRATELRNSLSEDSILKLHCAQSGVADILLVSESGGKYYRDVAVGESNTSIMAIGKFEWASLTVNSLDTSHPLVVRQVGRRVPRQIEVPKADALTITRLIEGPCLVSNGSNEKLMWLNSGTNHIDFQSGTLHISVDMGGVAFAGKRVVLQEMMRNQATEGRTNAAGEVTFVDLQVANYTVALDGGHRFGIEVKGGGSHLDLKLNPVRSFVIYSNGSVVEGMEQPTVWSLDPILGVVVANSNVTLGEKPGELLIGAPSGRSLLVVKILEADGQGYFHFGILDGGESGRVDLGMHSLSVFAASDFARMPRLEVLEVAGVKLEKLMGGIPIVEPRRFNDRWVFGGLVSRLRGTLKGVDSAGQSFAFPVDINAQTPPPITID